MALIRTKNIDLRSADYKFISPTTDGATTHLAGDVVEVEETAGFTLVDVPINTKFTLVTEASQTRAKKAAEAIDSGDALFWNNATKLITKVATLDRIGEAIESALLGDATVLLSWDSRSKNVIP